ncbi:MAG: 50S ribosomal protein L25 [Actinobacteria bacterium]|nr:50S ribosomal protein L25 [Actinomycetota bacterium]
MAEVTLALTTGRQLGSRPSNRLRATGQVPGVVYGQGIEPLPVAVAWSDLRAALSTEAGLNALLDLQIDGETHLAIVKELQRHPVRHTVHHVDFTLIDRNAELQVDVPVVIEGEAIEVTRENGIVDQIVFNLAVWARPEHIPNELTVDISGLTLGESLRVTDIVLPDGVRTDADPEEPVVVTSVTRAAMAAAGAEDAEGAGEAGGGDDEAES